MSVAIGADVVVVDDVLDQGRFDALGHELRSAVTSRSTRASGTRRGDWATVLRCAAAPCTTTRRAHSTGRVCDTRRRVWSTTSSTPYVDLRQRILRSWGERGSTGRPSFSRPGCTRWEAPCRCTGTAVRTRGAFTFFAHPRWGVHWGGELVVLDDEESGAQHTPLGVTGWIEEDQVGSALGTLRLSAAQPSGAVGTRPAAHDHPGRPERRRPRPHEPGWLLPAALSGSRRGIPPAWHLGAQGERAGVRLMGHRRRPGPGADRPGVPLGGAGGRDHPVRHGGDLCRGPRRVAPR